MTQRPKPVALIILDGFALREETYGNAVAQSKSPILTATGISTRMQPFRRADWLSACRKGRWATPRSAT